MSTLISEIKYTRPVLWTVLPPGRLKSKPRFWSPSSILWAFSFTPVNNLWLGSRFCQVLLLKVETQLRIQYRGPRKCIMGLTTELPQTVRQKAHRFMSWFQRGNWTKCCWPSLMQWFSVQLRHVCGWSLTLIKDEEDKGKELCEKSDSSHKHI